MGGQFFALDVTRLISRYASFSGCDNFSQRAQSLQVWLRETVLLSLQRSQSGKETII